MEELERYAELNGKLMALEAVVRNISLSGCAKISERERELGEMVGALKALHAEMGGVSVRLHTIEESLNRIIGQRQSHSAILYGITVLTAAIVSAIIGFFRR